MNLYLFRDFRIFAVRNYVEYIINNGGTANICAIDITKAFDKLNHYCIFYQADETQVTFAIGRMFI